MKENKKSFFYNPFFRVSIYIMAWSYIGCFKLIAIINPKLGAILERSEKGDLNATLMVGFASGIIFTLFLFLLVHKNVNWDVKALFLVPLIYLMIALIGSISLVKLRDYQLEQR